MNLFVGVTIDKFNEMKEKQEKSVFLTDEQQSWVTIQRLLVGIRLKKTANRPLNRMRNFIYDVVTSRSFETLILCLIMANILVMSMTHADMSDEFENVLFLLNCRRGYLCDRGDHEANAFQPSGYFRIPEHVYFMVLTLSVAINGDLDHGHLSYVSEHHPCVCVARIFRLIPKAKGLKLFQTLVYSLPALGNVGSVLFLFFFIFAVLGMNLFVRFHHRQLPQQVCQLRDVRVLMLTLFRMAAGEARAASCTTA